MKLDETIREDGLRIVTCRVPSKKVHIALEANVGSAYDPPERRGLFHYFEHMAFKGTQKRNVQDIHAFGERNFLNHNAFTGRIGTRYYGEAVTRKWPLLTEWLSDLFFRSEFPAEEVEREKEVVLNEIARDWDIDQYVAHFILWEKLWRENPMREFGVGTPKGVSQVTRHDLLAAHKAWYVPSNTAAIAVGKIDHDAFVAEVNQHVPLSAVVCTLQDWGDECDEIPSVREAVRERPEREKAVVMFGCKFPRYVDDHTAVAVNFMNQLLVRGTTSILWSELREKRGLAYALHGGVDREYPLGYYFYVMVETLPKRIDTVRALVMDFLFRPLDNEVAFENARESLYDQNSMEFEHPGSWTNVIMDRIRMGIPLKRLERHFQRRKKIIQIIDVKTVEALRARTLLPERFVTSIVKPA